MFFYVDESGHTGANLFDSNQPTLYYGVLSSKVNVDLVAEGRLRRMRSLLGRPRVHASEVGGAGIAKLVPNLLDLQRQLKLNFDLYRVEKADHALICFFDQVFDQGMNPAVPWHCYWTPMRYVLLLKLARLFDNQLLQEVWSARVDLNDQRANAVVSRACETLISRLDALPDRRSREILSDSLGWAAANPGSLRYNAKSKEEAISVAPNTVGFQSVMFGIASRIQKARPNRVSVTVDKQSQFNKAQATLTQWYQKAKGNVSTLELGPGMPKMDLRGIPDSPLRFSSGDQSAGLELVDTFLWVFKRYLENRDLPIDVILFVERNLTRGITDTISLESISRRWTPWFDALPEPAAEQIAAGAKLQGDLERARKKALAEFEDDAQRGVAPDT